MPRPSTPLPERWGPEHLIPDGLWGEDGLPVRLLGQAPLLLAFRPGSPVSHLLLQERPTTALVQGRLSMRDGTIFATMIHPDTTAPADACDLRRRAAEALDFGIGFEAARTEQALLGWADALLEALPKDDRLRQDRERGMALLLQKGFWIGRRKDLQSLPAAVRPEGLRARARRLLETRFEGTLVRRATLMWPAPATAHEALARRDMLTRLQDPAP